MDDDERARFGKSKKTVRIASREFCPLIKEQEDGIYGIPVNRGENVFLAHPALYSYELAEAVLRETLCMSEGVMRYGTCRTDIFACSGLVVSESEEN